MTTHSAIASTDSLKKSIGLKTNALGVWALFAQGVAAISPTMTAVLIIPLAFASAGEGTWLAYAFGTVMLLTVVFCLNQFAKRSASAGSMYAYTGRGLGAKTGVLSGWTLIWSYFFIAVAGMCGFAVFCGQLISALGYHGIDPSDLLLHDQRPVVLGDRLQGHPGVLHPHPRARRRPPWP